jgi:hypothetical protein
VGDDSWNGIVRKELFEELSILVNSKFDAISRHQLVDFMSSSHRKHIHIPIHPVKIKKAHVPLQNPKTIIKKRTPLCVQPAFASYRNKYRNFFEVCQGGNKKTIYYITTHCMLRLSYGGSETLL